MAGLKQFLQSVLGSGKGPGDSRTADEWLADAREKQGAGELRAAVAAYRMALERGAQDPDLHLQLGVLHASLAEYEPAIDALNTAIARSPQSADAVCMLGTVMADMRRPGEAARLLERALALQPDLSPAYFNLGLAQFEQADFAAAAASFSKCIALNRGEPWSAERRVALARDPQPSFEPRDMAVNHIKLRHDCEQIEYLLSLGVLPPVYREVLEDYRALLQRIGTTDIESIVPFDAARHPLVARTYKRPVHIAEVRPPAGPLINPALDFRGIQERYLAADPKVMAVDGLLTREALSALRHFCLESTFWNNIKRGYLGAYFHDGFFSELLLRLAWELRESFPAIFRDLPLQMLWGYKCESNQPGLGIHADAAAVNVNFWITDDTANLDPQAGGLLVYPANAPEHWGFSKFNNDSAALQHYLLSKGGEPIRVPYRANRAVIFDSDLFHATDTFRFQEGYLNRRINITLLYGRRSP